MTSSLVTLNLVGDVQPNRAEPGTMFRHVSDLLSTGDINLCQLECTISDKGMLTRSVRNPSHRVPPRNVEALTAAPFHGVTFAGNNNLDYGDDAFFDTLARLESQKIFVVGAGRDLDDARAPVVRSVGDVKVAFLNACSILPHGYGATADRPGIAPLSVQTYYEPLEKLDEQPGTPARTITIANKDELEQVLEQIRRAKEVADLVVACFHWGVHFTHDLANYQAEVAYAAVDAGADVVVGTHPHCLQAVDVYKGKPIFYSLGNFAFEQPGDVAMKGAGSYLRLYGMPADTEVPGHPHPRHCRPSVVVQIEASREGIESLALIPTYLNSECEPVQVVPGQREYDEVTKLLIDLSAQIGTSLTPDNGVLRIQDLASEKADTRQILRRQNISYPSLRRLSTEVY